MPQLRVDSVEMLKTLNYDHIVIAIENEQVMNEIRESLHEMGIKDSVIIWKNQIA